MGNRISISFYKKHRYMNGDDYESAAFFSHWRGKQLLEDVKAFSKWYEKIRESRLESEYSDPFMRKDPDFVIMLFSWWVVEKRLGEGFIVDGDYYIGKNDKDGDNSDNGHYIIDVDDWSIKKKY